MNIAVIYKSKYGSTKQYAQWIANELDCQMFERSDISPKELSQFDLVIYGGGLYAGAIDGVGLVAKNPPKQFIVLAVGLTSPETLNHADILNRNIPQNLRTQTKLFYLRGVLDYERLKFFHKLGLKVLKTMLSKKTPETRTEDEKMMIEAVGEKLDFTDKDSIAPIVEYVRSIEALAQDRANGRK